MTTSTTWCATSVSRPPSSPDWIYNNRNQAERLWARLKEWRAVAVRYKKPACSFVGLFSLAAPWNWIKPK
jgi:transposase